MLTQSSRPKKSASRYNRIGKPVQIPIVEGSHCDMNYDRTSEVHLINVKEYKMSEVNFHSALSHSSSRLRPTVFLDRDGTINAEVHFLSQPEQLQLLPTVSETIAMLNSQKIAVVVVTNQAGIARGYFPEHRLLEIHNHLKRMLGEHHAHVDGIYYCPHHPTAGLGAYRVVCTCRKPMPGMLTRAAAELGLDLPRSLMIGDRESDLQAGASAGCQTALVTTGYGEETSATIEPKRLQCIGIFHSVAEAVKAWSPPPTIPNHPNN